tara:strand:- start:2358 stop:2474 length:117 start_codon:yes stop_codon:yes gene_type:complete
MKDSKNEKARPAPSKEGAKESDKGGDKSKPGVRIKPKT